MGVKPHNSGRYKELYEEGIHHEGERRGREAGGLQASGLALPIHPFICITILQGQGQVL